MGIRANRNAAAIAQVQAQLQVLDGGAIDFDDSVAALGVETLQQAIDVLVSIVKSLTYKREFDQSDLSGNLLVVDHQLGTAAPRVTILDSTGEEIAPDRITRLDSNRIEIDLGSYLPLDGTHALSIFGTN